MPGGKPPTRELIQKLLTDGYVEVKNLISKKGKPYKAVVMIDCSDDGNARVRPVFEK